MFCVSRREFTLITFCMGIGSLMACTVTGFLMSKFGRRPLLIGFLLITFFGWLFLAFSGAPWSLYIGRLLVGYGQAGSSVVLPIYLAEIAKTSVRGRILTLVQQNMQLGMLVTYLFGIMCQMFVVNLICVVIVFAYCVTLLFIPETPSYLVSARLYCTSRKAK